MAGGSVAQLYGGCLGRYTGNADLSVDSRFRSSSKTPGGAARHRDQRERRDHRPS